MDLRKDSATYATYNLWGTESSIYTSYGGSSANAVPNN